MKKLIITFFIVVGLHIEAGNVEKERLVRAERTELISVSPKFQEQVKFNELVEFIKLKEGWRSKPYICLGGYRTIGYGFVTKYIGKQFSNTITKQQGDSIIRAKLRQNIAHIKRLYPLLNSYQQMAISSLIYAKGLGRVKSHPVHNQLKKGFVNYETFVYFSRWEVERKHYRKARLFEYNLFNFKT